MKKIIVLILFIDLGCTQKINVISTNKVIQVNYGKKSKNSKNAILYFMDGFSDNIIVNKNDSLIFSGLMKTNENHSFSGSIFMKNIRNNDSIQIKYSKEIVKFNFSEKYPQIEIYNLPDFIKINFIKFSLKNLE